VPEQIVAGKTEMDAVGTSAIVTVVVTGTDEHPALAGIV
jgi:hypothetical protein